MFEKQQARTLAPYHATMAVLDTSLSRASSLSLPGLGLTDLERGERSPEDAITGKYVHLSRPWHAVPR